MLLSWVNVFGIILSTDGFLFFKIFILWKKISNKDMSVQLHKHETSVRQGTTYM